LFERPKNRLDWLVRCMQLMSVFLRLRAIGVKPLLLFLFFETSPFFQLTAEGSENWSRLANLHRHRLQRVSASKRPAS